MSPSVAVVVATHDRGHLLPRLAAALSAQDLDGPFEVVIVDDGSGDDTGAVLASMRGITVRRHDRARGPAAARNTGWRATSAEIVAFTDDDCVPEPGWLRGLVDAVAGGADVAQGRTIPDPDQAHLLGPFSRTLSVEREDGYYQTCNIAYRRSLLECLGGFDERFRHPTGEDTDLAWRARDAGARTAFVAGAVVRHDVRPSSFLTHLRDTRRWEGVVLCTRLHPGLRELFHSRWFWKGSHPSALVAAAGIAVAVGRRRPAVLALTLPYMRHRTSVSPLRGGPRRRAAAIPAALVADVAEVAVLAGASVRYRSLLL